VRAVDDSADLGAVIGAGRPDTDAGQIRPPTTAVFAGGGGGGLPVTAACAPLCDNGSPQHTFTATTYSTTAATTATLLVFLLLLPVVNHRMCTFFSGESESQNYHQQQ